MRFLMFIALMVLCGRLASQDKPLNLLDRMNKMEMVNRSGQALLIMGDRPGKPFARVSQFEKKGGRWVPVDESFPAVIGMNGFAPMGEKAENDGRTPSGVYTLSSVFGYAPNCNTKMPYRQTSKSDVWVTDPKSGQYNTLVQGKPLARSFEKMYRDDKVYQWGIVVDYNASPIIPGKGSAVFLHVWYKPSSVTKGSAAFAENDMLSLLGWLDPAQKPIVIFGTARQLWDYSREVSR